MSELTKLNYADLLEKAKQHIKDKETGDYDKSEPFNAIVGNIGGFYCKKCKNKGVYYTVKEDGEIIANKCSCIDKRIEQAYIKQTGIEKLFKKYRLDNFECTQPFQVQMVQNAIDFYNNREACFFFIGGQSGCGKTHICTALTGKFIEHLKPVKYMLWRDHVTKLKQLANDARYIDMITPFKLSEILYIDDMFKTQKGKPVTQGDINVAFEIINYRYNNELKTIISSELTIEQIIEIDEATGSRINELCGDYVMNIASDRKKNYRLK